MHKLLLAFIVLSGFISSFVRAADISEIVTIANRTESEQSQLLVSTAVVDKNNLQLLSHSHIQESVARLAGVNLNRGNGQEYLPAIRSPVLTGAGACGGFVMAEDGIPLRASGFCNINELFEAHSEVAQRLEVLRGPGTVLYGSNAIHGVINVITPAFDEPKRMDLEFADNQYQRLKLFTGSDDFSLATSLTHDGGYRDQAGFDQQKLSLKHRYQSDKLSVISGFTATNLNQETAGYISGEDAYKDPSLARSNPNPEAYRDVRSARLWSRMAYHLAEAELLVTPYLRHTKMDFLQHFLPGDPLEKNGQTGAGIQLSYHFSPQRQINLILGADAEYTDAFLQQSQDAPTQGSAFLRETIPQGRHYDYEVEAQVAALFANMQWAVDQAWTWQAGLRFESTHYDYKNLMADGRTRDDGSSCGFGGCRYSRPASGTNSYTNWSADMGFIYQLYTNHSAYARLSRAFRAPQATELYRLQRDQQITDLQPENISGFEMGVRGEGEAWRYTVAVYYMEKDHHIYRDADFFNVSDGNTEHQGIELEASWQFSSELELNLSATHAIHRYLHSRQINEVEIRGNDIDSAPRYFGNARVSWQPLDQTRFELEWQLMGDYFLDPQNQYSYPGHSLFNLRASHRVSDRFSVYGRLLNITDRGYATRADYTSFSGERFFPGRSRTLSLGVQWRW